MDKKFKEAYAAMAKDPAQRHSLASLIVEYIDTNHITENIISLFLDTRHMEPGDMLVKKVRSGIEVRTLVPGSIHLASEITVTDRLNYMLDGVDIKVRANQWELESGEIGTVESIRKEMMAQLSDAYIRRIFTAGANIWNAVNTPLNYAVSVPLTAAALRTGIDRVNYAVGKAKAVVGTRLALAPITQFAGFHVDATTANVWGNAEAISEIYKTGWLGQWYGVPIVALDQVWNDPVNNAPQLPNNRVGIWGEHVGEFITYGEPKWKEWTHWDPTPPDWLIEVYQQFGMIIDRADGIYVIRVA